MDNKEKIQEKLQDLKDLGVKVNDEEKKPEENAKENSKTGIQSKTNTLIDDTNLAAKRIEEATAAAREERLAAEESYSKMKLSGTTEAGQAPAKPKEETDEEYAEKFNSGEVNPFSEDDSK